MSSSNFEKVTSPSGSRETLRKIGARHQADADSVTLTLFSNARHEACGWFIGPLAFKDGRFVLPFLSKSDETMAPLAIVRALEAAKVTGRPLCLVDPEDLWDRIWRI